MSSSPEAEVDNTFWVIDATRRTIFLAYATRYAALFFIVPILLCAVIGDGLEVAIVVVVGNLHDERYLLFVLTLALGAQRTPIVGDAVLVQLFERLVEIFVLRALVPCGTVAVWRVV